MDEKVIAIFCFFYITFCSSLNRLCSIYQNATSWLETKFLACSESENNYWNKKGVSVIWAFKLCVAQSSDMKPYLNMMLMLLLFLLMLLMLLLLVMLLLLLLLPLVLLLM